MWTLLQQLLSRLLETRPSTTAHVTVNVMVQPTAPTSPAQTTPSAVRAIPVAPPQYPFPPHA